MGKKQKIQYKSQQELNFLDDSILFQRYVFFDSLFNSSSTDLNTLGLNAKNALSDPLRSSQIVRQKNPSQYINSTDYIAEYIHMLESLADAEFVQEKKYIQSLSKDDFPIEDFLKRDHIDYIGFIAALNKVQTDSKLLNQIIKTNKDNMQAIKSQMKDISKDTNTDEYGRTQYENLIRNYKFYYSNYSHSMRDLVDDKIKDTVVQQINNKINEIIANMSKDEDFINLALEKLNKKGDIIAILRNTAVEYVQQQLIHNDFDLSKLTSNIESIKNSDNLENILNKAAEQQYNHVMDTIKSDMNQILEKSFRHLSGIADIILDTPSTLDEICDAIGIEKHDNNPLRNSLKEQLARTQKAIKDNTATPENHKKAVARAKSALSRELNKLIRSSEDVKKPLEKSEARALVTKIINAYQQSISTFSENAAKAIGKQLKITNLTASSTAEIVASPGFLNYVKEHVSDFFIPGKEIQYKADLAFNFIADTSIASQIEFKDSDNMEILDLWAEEQATNRGELFLKKYKESAHGATSVEKAAQDYEEILKEAQARKVKLLNAADEANQELINKYFKNKVNSSISVKEYRYYDTKLGYHMGSMGGSGKVDAAIPNILKMLDLGGIDELDADVIITALYNCFNDSVIGKEHKTILEDIKNLLIGGAAMMLFDDGFANAEHFLEKMKEELKVKSVNELPTGGSLHLLQLNSVYIPYSYVLTNIIEHLKRVYSAILMQNEPTKNLTGPKQRSTLELFNPLSSDDLQKIEKNANFPTSLDKWNAMSDLASEEVKIHFLFMSGMLDIMKNLERVFDPKSIK